MVRHNPGPWARGLLAVAGTWAVLTAPGPLSAASFDYTLDLIDGRRIAYQIPVRVDHPGNVVVDADWEVSRILAFRVEREGAPPFRRSGPSPQRIEIVIDAAETLPANLTVHIAGLPAGGGGKGHIRIRVPDAPAVVAAREAAAAPPPPPPPEPEPWMAPLTEPGDSRADRRDVFETIEAFRRSVIDEAAWELGYDPCRWQEGTLRYLAEQWRRIAAGGPAPAIATRRYFRNLSRVATQVESFRDSDDPLLAGPPPPDRSKRFLWLKAREPRVRPLERELDRLVIQLEDGFVPELESEDWPQRLIACLTACQRHFDDLAVHGPEAASNGRLAATQWEPILAASRAFGALSMVSASNDRAELRP